MMNFQYIEYFKLLKKFKNKKISFIKEPNKDVKNFEFLRLLFCPKLKNRNGLNKNVEITVCSCDAVKQYGLDSKKVCSYDIHYNVEKNIFGNYLYHMKKGDPMDFWYFCEIKKDNEIIQSEHIEKEYEERYYYEKSKELAIKKGNYEVDLVLRTDQENKFVRLRYKKNRWFLNLKILGNISDEVTIEYSRDIKELLDILFEIGLKPHLIIEKYRFKERQGNLEICYDYLPQIDEGFVELEGNKEEIQKKVKELNLSKTTPPYDEILQKKFKFCKEGYFKFSENQKINYDNRN